MNKLDDLKNRIDKLYKAKNPNAASWKDWIYPNHVLVVTNTSEKLAIKYNARIDLVVSGALLHDVADTAMSRDNNEEHDKKSLEMARDLLSKSNFGSEEIETIINEIITPHSCKEIKPSTVEGKILATADAMAHLTTDFYLHFCWTHEVEPELDIYKKWVLKKIERDFNDKIFFEEEKQLVKENYKSIKLLFSK